MLLKESQLCGCRYGDNASNIWGEWEILWEFYEDDYQGFVKFMATNGKEIVYYEWDYGSCSGCDDWEDRELSEEEIENEMKKDAVTFNYSIPKIKLIKKLFNEDFQEDFFKKFIEEIK